MFKKFKIKRLKKKLGEKNVIIGNNSKFKNTNFEGNNEIGERVDISNSYIGRGSCINDDSKLPNCKIKKFSCIGPNVNIAIGTHPTRNYVTTHTFAYNSYSKRIGLGFVEDNKFDIKEYIEGTNYHIEIGNDVWIGKNVTILSGVTIGDGAILAAGAVIHKDVEPYSIVGGIPAKEIRKRFSEEEINFLENIKWWDKDLTWIKNNIDSFNDIKKFMTLI